MKALPRRPKIFPTKAPDLSPRKHENPNLPGNPSILARKPKFHHTHTRFLHVKAQILPTESAPTNPLHESSNPSPRNSTKVRDQPESLPTKAGIRFHESPKSFPAPDPSPRKPKFPRNFSRKPNRQVLRSHKCNNRINLLGRCWLITVDMHGIEFQLTLLLNIALAHKGVADKSSGFKGVGRRGLKV